MTTFPIRRARSLCLASAAVLLAAPGVAAQSASGPAEDVAAIRELIDATRNANNAGDVDAWVSLFAEDAVYMPPGAPATTTRAALVEVARAGFVHAAAIELRPAEIRVRGDWAFARNHVVGQVTLDGSGEVITIDVKQIVIYRREHGEWRIARMIGNSNEG
jgi:uncharacterized protein (TIGR02246 family)